MFYKFKKGKSLLSVPNGVGDGSAYFDGSTYAELSDSNLPMGNSARSIVISVYRTGFQGEYRVFFRYGLKADNRMMSLGITENDTILLNLHGTSFVFESVPLEIKKWWQIVVTYSDGVETLYLNGVKQSTVTHSATNTSPNVLSLGNWFKNLENFQGNMKNLSIYNRALTAEEVTALYNKQEITDGRVLNIPLQYEKDDESMFTSKNFVYDYSIVETSSGFNTLGKPIGYRSASGAGIDYTTLNKNLLLHHTFTGLNADTGQVFTIPREEPIFTTFGDIQCCNFTSRNPIVTMDFADIENAIIANQEMSLSLWVHSTANYYRQHWGNVFGSYFCTLSFNKDVNAFNLVMNDEYRLDISYENYYNKWTHICVIAKNNIAKIYIDNTLVGEVTDFGTFAQNISNIHIGGNPSGEYNDGLNGYMADLRIYGRALTDKEIQQLANEYKRV